MELSDAHLLEALKLLPAAEQRSFDVCLAAEIETVQDRMRLAAVAAAAAKTEKAAAAKEKEKAAAAAKREKEKMAAVARAVVEAMAEAAASMTQAAMRAAVEAGIETRQEAARALQRCEANRLPSAAGERGVGSVTTPSERARTWRLESFGWRRQQQSWRALPPQSRT